MKRGLSLLALLVLLLMATSVAWGRAGGGEGYSGGSGSSRSSSRSSGGYSSGPTPASAAPILWGLIVFMVVMGGLILAKTESDSTRQAIAEKEAKRRAAEQSPEQISEGLARLSARDSTFREDDFVTQARRLFLLLQQAWSEGAFEPVRRGMSDGVLRRFQTQVALNRFFGTRNVTVDVKVREAAIAAVECDAKFDTLHVRISASARDCDVPANTPDAAAFSRAARAAETAFVEYWSFVRRLNPEAGSRPAGGKCPSCGASVPHQATLTCDHCGVILNSGTHDWVLSEITQEDVFAMQSPREVEGLVLVSAYDPALNRQVLEDRASLVFWKWIEARASGEPARFARLCTAAALDQLSKVKATPDAGLAKTAVGAIDLAHVESVADFDRATFEVRWSAAGGLPRSSMLTLARRTGVKTSPKTGLSTDRCSSCYAPQSDSESVECSSCGSLLSQDWAFEDLVSVEAWQARHTKLRQARDGLSERVIDIADPYERRRILAVMVAMASANGVITDGELRMLSKCAKRWAIGEDELLAMAGAKTTELTEIQPQSQGEARVLYRALVAAALVDGRIDAAEQKLLLAMAAHLRLQPEEAEALARELRDSVNCDRLTG